MIWNWQMMIANALTFALVIIVMKLYLEVKCASES